MAGEREEVWFLLSELFLDTEIDADDFERLADALAASAFSIPELTAIMENEVAPVLYPNLLSVAGQWGMFERDWLIERITARLQRLQTYPSRAPLLVRFFQMAVVKHDWQRLLALIVRKRRRSCS